MSEAKKTTISQYNIEGKKLEALLGPLEASIIETIWCSKKRPLTVREVHETLKKDKKIAYTTVMSTMDRLHNKGLLDRRIEKGKGGMYYVYWPKLEEQNFKESAVREIIDSLIENFGDIVTNCLVEKTAIKNDKLRTLKEQSETSVKEKKK
ncbi:MAG TPA: BlaI/MecI/CopY family transcriptional regulator [Candidatus Bathyarchaeia archaeon]|nr:BlaI/MecI/CopY family transcriptional regulator [Candidatus Bathyarchaeia archaeon]